jgi:fluoroacetyl-CoA thioesterase
MRQIPLGAKGTFTLRVLPEHLANQFKDAMLPQVLATPVMILIVNKRPRVTPPPLDGSIV